MNDSRIKIAICDDSEMDRANVRRLCGDYFSSRRLSVVFTDFSSGQALLADDHEFDVLFLDIELGDMNGVDVMRQIENRHNIWKIIFTTSHDDYMADTFGTKTIGFLTKPASKLQLERCLSLVQKELLMLAQPMISIPGHNDIALRDILYIESTGSYYSLFMDGQDDKIVCSGSVTRFIEELNTFLLVCISKGLYVNLCHVTGNTDRTVTLSNGEVKQIRSTYAEEFKSKLRYYIRDYRR